MGNSNKQVDIAIFVAAVPEGLPIIFNRWQSKLQAKNLRLERENRQLSPLATVDSLTQTANRHYFGQFF